MSGLQQEASGGSSVIDRLAVVGAVATLASDEGGAMLSAGVYALAPLGESTDEPLAVTTLGLSLGEGNTRLLGELVHAEGTAGFLGLRLGNAKYAFDVGTVVTMDEGFIPLPLVSWRGRM